MESPWCLCFGRHTQVILCFNVFILEYFDRQSAYMPKENRIRFYFPWYTQRKIILLFEVRYEICLVDSNQHFTTDQSFVQVSFYQRLNYRWSVWAVKLSVIRSWVTMESLVARIWPQVPRFEPEGILCVVSQCPQIKDPAQDNNTEIQQR